MTRCHNEPVLISRSHSGNAVFQSVAGKIYKSETFQPLRACILEIVVVQPSHTIPFRARNRIPGYNRFSRLSIVPGLLIARRRKALNNVVVLNLRFVAAPPPRAST